MIFYERKKEHDICNIIKKIALFHHFIHHAILFLIFFSGPLTIYLKFPISDPQEGHYENHIMM